MKKKLLTLTALIALVAVVALVFTACLPADAEKAKAKLEKAGYEVEAHVFEADELDDSEIKGLESSVMAFSEDFENYVILYYFDSAENAKAAYDEFVENEADEEGEIEYGRSGKVLYAGTKDAVKVIK